MDSELRDSEIRVLKVLGRIRHPVGYFGIVARLELRKRVLKEHLAGVLDSLVGRGLAEFQPMPGHRFGAYRLTEAGQEWLDAEFAAREEARQARQ
ncbi:MAG TPA: hypothetical protein VD886_03200 [Herpetosiphonaceae bacterium]|nr:hypothetical protein [Herpetosiphonaceae bacterium]